MANKVTASPQEIQEVKAMLSGDYSKVPDKDMIKWDHYAKANGLLGPEYDYRLEARSGIPRAENGHSTDIGKLPNHLTYSTQSAYAKAGLGNPGVWVNNNFTMSKKQANPGRIDFMRQLVRTGRNDNDRYFLPNGKEIK